MCCLNKAIYPMISFAESDSLQETLRVCSVKTQAECVCLDFKYFRYEETGEKKDNAVKL